MRSYVTRRPTGHWGEPGDGRGDPSDRSAGGADPHWSETPVLTRQTAANCLAVLVGAGVVQYWHVALLATCYGLAFTLDMPTRQAFVVEMASKADLPNAIALNSSMVSGARMVGPAIAGLRYAVHTPLVALPLSLLLTLGLFVTNHNVLVPLLARDVLHAGAHGFGPLMAAVGTGAILGALALATLLTGRPPFALLLGTAGAAAGLTLALAGIRSFGAALLALTGVGLAQMVFVAACNTTLQLVVPDRMRGRVMSLYAFVFVGSTPLGALFVGTTADWVGVSACWGGGGGPRHLIPSPSRRRGPECSRGVRCPEPRDSCGTREPGGPPWADPSMANSGLRRAGVTARRRSDAFSIWPGYAPEGASMPR